jgi:hypothetical protein
MAGKPPAEADLEYVFTPQRKTGIKPVSDQDIRDFR